MANKFNRGDKVIKKGTTQPIMIVEGNTVKPNFPEYTRLDDRYTCTWNTNIGRQREEFDEDELEFYQE